ncbi:RNA-binding protein 7 [Anolis carolinensis]|uniref:RNA-binding protein 7 n=1 Tax=Anolis carolinensis TaxID=28377 RepID=UPI002F2B681F
MGAAAAEADRTLFVGNLDPGVTEELLFELFLQGGPVLNVKIPKDREGKAKSFAFVNFKHEESVPYGMSLLNGIKLFGRPLKIQFRSGSSHASQDNGALYSSQNGGLSVAQHQQQAPATNTNSWYERSTENFSAASSSSSVSRSFSSFPLENLQRQAVLVSSGGAWQQQQQASPLRVDASFPFLPPPCRPSPWCHEASSLAQRKARPASRPYPAEGRHYGREQQPMAMAQRGGDHFHPHGGWSHDYSPHSRREGKWQRPSRH